MDESTCLTSDYAANLQSSIQYGTGQRQKHRSMEQNRNPRNTSMQLWTPYLWQRRPKYTWKKDNLTSDAGKTGQPAVKE